MSASSRHMVDVEVVPCLQVPLLAYVGRLTGQKGMDVLLSALPALFKTPAGLLAGASPADSPPHAPCNAHHHVLQAAALCMSAHNCVTIGPIAAA
jgi:glycosyltransferase involved in cell wall biosynthesis